MNSGDPSNEITPLPAVVVSGGSGKASITTAKATTSPVNLGDTGVFAVSVSPSTAMGSVTLWDTVGPRTLATTISGGTATVQFPWPQAGSVTLYAVYSGDSAYAGSASAPVTFTVKKGTPQVALTAPASSAATQQVSLNVSVSGAPANPLLAYPSGIVEFWDSVNGGPAQLLTAQTLTAGAGNIGVYATRRKFPPGTHAMHAHYRGDNNWQAVDSVVTTLTTWDFTVDVTPNVVSLPVGSPGSATVTITPLGGFTGW